MANLLPLFVPPALPFNETPFSDDRFSRKELGTALTGYIGRLKFGAVLAIDAEWGQGKTWFAKNWQQQLINENHPVIYIDAFESDYMGDPFSMITGEMLTIIKSDEVRANFISKARDVALAVVPTAIKVGFSVGGKWILGMSDFDKTVSDEIEKVSDSAEQQLGKVLEDKIKNYQQDKQSIRAFRETLSKFAGTCDKPMVVIIDELDRCKPQFAVSLLERIKHFFDVPNVVFVLFMHKTQLHNAIKGVYGQDTDAHLYLDKFLNFTFTLEHSDFRNIRDFAELELAKYEISMDTQVSEFLDGLTALASVFSITPRQVERAIALLALAYPFNTGGILLAELVALKLKRPDLLDGLLRQSRTAEEEILDMIESHLKINPSSGYLKNSLEFLSVAHRALLEQEQGDYTNRLSNEYGLKKERIRRDYTQMIKLLNIVTR